MSNSNYTIYFVNGTRQRRENDTSESTFSAIENAGFVMYDQAKKDGFTEMQIRDGEQVLDQWMIDE